MSSNIITRFAPSPTGFLHIGGARTALFNWVYAKHMNGKMLLRIEDTDKTRSTQQATDAILNGLSWLGINWDDDVISQNSRTERHKEVAYELVKQGKAYFCYCSPKELEEMRENALAKGEIARYNGYWRDKNENEHPKDITPVIRIKIPQTGNIVINDIVQGEITFNNKDFDDFIILRSDGSPTYMHAVVVDDHDMGITHIIRGDDHLTNTAKQAILYNAIDWEMPLTAHIPLIHGEDGAKLSKRHGAMGVEAYREMGYLPQAIKNYLIRLGWSHGNDEIMSIEQVVEWFDLKDINKSASRFDFKKLNSLNAHYIKNTDTIELYNYLISELEILDKQNIFNELKLDIYKNQIISALAILKERAKTLCELLTMLEFIITKPASAQITENEPLIIAFINKLKSIDNWNKDNLTQIINEFLNLHNIKMPLIGKPLRLILTGNMSSLGVSDILMILGQKESLQRLNNML